MEALEEVLISADVGIAATERIVTPVRNRARRNESLRDLVKDEIRGIFDSVEPPAFAVTEWSSSACHAHRGRERDRKNDDGRKLANLLKNEDGSRWCARLTRSGPRRSSSSRSGRSVPTWTSFAAKEGSDPAAVVFDAIQSGRARGCDPILVDTAGRLHNRVNLMNELDKIRRVAARRRWRAARSVARPRRDGGSERGAGRRASSPTSRVSPASC
jgi:fused signal recognition particle receptor